MNSKEIVTKSQTSVNKETFGIVYTSSFSWCKDQKPSIQKLWFEAWESDQFGDRWVELETSLPDSTFRQARKALKNAGLFDFRTDTNPRDNRKTQRWLVRNLKGSKSHLVEFGKTSKKTTLSKRRIQYHKFLKSPYWLEVRDLVLARDGYTCQMCGVTKNLQVHHLTYKNHRHEKEHLEDLVTLCKHCHKKEH
jgi:hypothetical protein